MKEKIRQSTGRFTQHIARHFLIDRMANGKTDQISMNFIYFFRVCNWTFLFRIKTKTQQQIPLGDDKWIHQWMKRNSSSSNKSYKFSSWKLWRRNHPIIYHHHATLTIPWLPSHQRCFISPDRHRLRVSRKAMVQLKIQITTATAPSSIPSIWMHSSRIRFIKCTMETERHLMNITKLIKTAYNGQGRVCLLCSVGFL